MPPVEVRLQPGLAPVLKHGRHNQKDHAGKRGASELPEGWTQVSKEDLTQRAIDRARSDWAVNTPEERLRDIIDRSLEGVAQYQGPNGTVVDVFLPGGKSIDDAAMNDALGALSKCQEVAPVKDLKVVFSDTVFKENADIIGESAGGFVIRGEKQINIRPEAAAGEKMLDAKPGWFTESSKDVSEMTYVMTHEYGHVLDLRKQGAVNKDAFDFNAVDVSDYGKANEFEKYAEAFTEYTLTGGQTSNNGARLYGERYSWLWDRGVEKAVGDEEVERLVIVDTFKQSVAPFTAPPEDDAASSIVKFAAGLVPVLKFNPRQPRAKDGRWTKGGASWGGDFAGSPFEPSASEIDYNTQMENIDYIMGRSPFPPGYSYEGLPPPTVTLRQLGREQVAKVRKRIKKFKEERERRYLANLTPKQRDELIAANRAREAKFREERGLPPVVYKSIDPVLPLLYSVFRDVVDDPFVWLAFVQDERPLLEIDGDLGDILDDMLDVVAPRGEVIKFAPGLRPTLKHLSGKHDQKAHGRGGGNGSTGGQAPGGGKFSAWGDRERELNVAARFGPTRDALNAALYSEDSIDMVDADVVRQRIADEYDYEIESAIEARMGRTLLMEDDAEIEATRERYYEEELDGQVELRGRDMAETIAAEERQEYWNSPEAIEQMNEVYGTSHEGVTRDGVEVRIDANVDSITPPYFDGDVLKVEGTLRDGYDGSVVGRFERQFQQDGKGGVKVSHELLEIDDESYQGAGFSKTFNRNAENYYISHGIDTIDVHAALDGGGYTWASSGFDFDTNPSKLSKTRDNLDYRTQGYLDNVAIIPPRVRGEIENLRSRINLDPTDADFPTPKEFADIGRLPGAESWPGKVIMRGSNWYGTKKLRPEGARKSATQQWMEDRAAANRAEAARRAPGRGQKTFDRDFEDAASPQGGLFPPTPGVVQ